MNTKCHNCPKPAMFMSGSDDAQIPLCLDCYAKLSQVITAQNAMLEKQLNRIQAEAYETVGLPIPSRLHPQPSHLHTEAINVSNISVNNSSVGVFNTGNLEIVNSSISVLNESGHEDIASALSELTDAVVKDTEITIEKQNEIIELISALATETANPQENRRSSVLKSLSSSLSNVIGTSAGLIAIWDKLYPLLEGLM